MRGPGRGAVGPKQISMMQIGNVLAAECRAENPALSPKSLKNAAVWLFGSPPGLSSGNATLLFVLFHIAHAYLLN